MIIGLSLGADGGSSGRMLLASTVIGLASMVV